MAAACPASSSFAAGAALRRHHHINPALAGISSKSTLHFARRTLWSRSLSVSCTLQQSAETTTSAVSTNGASATSFGTRESALILIRHGESLWNSKNLFTGCVDVPLSQTGVEEAIEAGKRISELPVDLIFTSALIRAQMTAMLAMTQHHRQKVPVILHNESERAKAWSTIFSDRRGHSCCHSMAAQ